MAERRRDSQVRLITTPRSQSANRPLRIVAEHTDRIETPCPLVRVALGVASGLMAGGFAICLGTQLLLTGTTAGQILAIPLIVFGTLAPLFGSIP